MEADLRRGILPAPDLEEACGGGPAHALSEESGVTADSSRSALLGDADSSSLVQSIEWTDEKHNLYLNLLERSFVDQLNHSKRMRGAILREVVGVPYPPSELPMENCASFDEEIEISLVDYRAVQHSTMHIMYAITIQLVALLKFQIRTLSMKTEKGILLILLFPKGPGEAQLMGHQMIKSFHVEDFVVQMLQSSDMVPLRNNREIRKTLTDSHSRNRIDIIFQEEAGTQAGR
ncbi:hypothetical protein CRG98_024038 [Punica granatum]|uniref:Uncharacterized protein n=1 Tax=Punica granatum TaxID=22663 RepID=A0A2I0JH07_PUNGR|nr:hypothetical protein CRG98_024038 [Punica granatum]